VSLGKKARKLLQPAGFFMKNFSAFDSWWRLIYKRSGRFLL
jgi:hypothetical protein